MVTTPWMSRSMTMATCTTEMAWAIRCPSLRNSPDCASVRALKLTPVTISSEESTVRRFPVKKSPSPTRRIPPLLGANGHPGIQGGQRGDGVVGRAGGHQVPHHRGPGLERRRSHLERCLRQRERSLPQKVRGRDIGVGDQRSQVNHAPRSPARSGRAHLSGRCPPTPPPQAGSRGASPAPDRFRRRSTAPDGGRRQGASGFLRRWRATHNG